MAQVIPWLASIHEPKHASYSEITLKLRAHLLSEQTLAAFDREYPGLGQSNLGLLLAGVGTCGYMLRNSQWSVVSSQLLNCGIRRTSQSTTDNGPLTTDY